MGAKKEKKSHYVVTEITKTQPLYLSEFPLTPTYYSRCEQLICLSELFFFPPSSTWKRLDSPQLQPVSSSLRDVFISALTSNPFQIPSSPYLHLFFTHPPALFRCTSPLPSSSRPVISSPPPPQQHLHCTSAFCLFIPHLCIKTLVCVTHSLSVTWKVMCFSHPLRVSVKKKFDSL